MKRITPLLLALVLAFALTCPALAAEAPEGTAPIRPAALYPTEVVETVEGDCRRLEKVYLLTAADNPANIPTEDFEREGYRYTLLDVTRQDYTESEREFNHQRQAEGIAAAKAKGVHFGRKFKDRGANYESVMAAWRRGELSGRAAAKELGVAHGTFQRWCKE